MFGYTHSNNLLPDTPIGYSILFESGSSCPLMCGGGLFSERGKGRN
jgi:hypothetical protein